MFDFKGNQIKEINDSNDEAVFIVTYYDKESLKNYIITGNVSNVKSYDYNTTKIYRRYGNNSQKVHGSMIITSNQGIVKLIESSWDGFFRIWNFHSGELLIRMRVGNTKIYSICLWNIKYLFVGCEDKMIKLVDLKTLKVVKNLIGHNKEVLSIQKVYHPKYGECLISQSSLKDQLKIWIKK